jgi:hypothetical protein
MIGVVARSTAEAGTDHAVLVPISTDPENDRHRTNPMWIGHLSLTGTDGTDLFKVLADTRTHAHTQGA